MDGMTKTVKDAILEYHTTKAYLVFYVNGYRIGSVEKNSDTLNLFEKRFVLSVLSTDTNGTIHYNVISPRHR